MVLPQTTRDKTCTLPVRNMSRVLTNPHEKTVSQQNKRYPVYVISAISSWSISYFVYILTTSNIKNISLLLKSLVRLYMGLRSIIRENSHCLWSVNYAHTHGLKEFSYHEIPNPWHHERELESYSPLGNNACHDWCWHTPQHIFNLLSFDVNPYLTIMIAFFVTSRSLLKEVFITPVV